MQNNTMLRNSLSSWRERGEQTPKLGRSAVSLWAHGLLTAHGAGFATCTLLVGSTPSSRCLAKGGRDMDGDVLLCMDQMTTSIPWCSSFRCKLEPKGTHPSNKEILCNNSIRQGSTRHLESCARNAGKHVIAIKIVDKNLPLDCRGFVPTLSCLVLLHPPWGCLALAAAPPLRKRCANFPPKTHPNGAQSGLLSQTLFFCHRQEQKCCGESLCRGLCSHVPGGVWGKSRLCAGTHWGWLLVRAPFSAGQRTHVSAFLHFNKKLLTSSLSEAMKEMLYHLKSLSEERAPATTHGWEDMGAVMEGQGLSRCTWARHTSGYQKHTAGSHFFFLNNLNFCYLVLARCCSQSHLSLSHPYYLEK